MERWRVKFKIEGRLAFLSHLDMLTAWERAFRRAELPVLLSEGFNPHLLMSFGPSHSVGMESESDYFDIDMADGLDEGWIEILNKSLPDGLQALAARIISAREPALMAAINLASYMVRLDFSACCDGQKKKQFVDQAITSFMKLAECMVERVSPKGRKTVDIRSGVKSLAYSPDGLLMEVSVGSRGNVRPHEVVNQAFPGCRLLSVRRTELFITAETDWLDRQLP